jgi:glycosyltransferase involved in cell wall biosynthesis
VPYYEGFGIPLIEAMQAQIPIITSNVTSLPEVAGKAALLVNPLDVVDIANAMIKLFENVDIQKQLIQQGNQQKQQFSWQKSGNLLWQSIQKTLSE